jgi:hypothetical protein
MLFASIAAAADRDQKAIRVFTRQLTGSRKASERTRAAHSLRHFKQPGVVDVLIEGLSDEDAGVRRACANSLWAVGSISAPARSELEKLLADPSYGVRVRAAAALEFLGMDPEALVAARTSALNAERLDDRILAARDLIGYADALPLLPPIIEVAEKEADTRSYDLGDYYLNPEGVLVQLVRSSRDRALITPLQTAVTDGHPGSKYLLKGLAAFEPLPENWVALLVSQLGASRADTRAAALDLLALCNTDAAGVSEWVGPAAVCLNDPDKKVRISAIMSLGAAKGFAHEAAGMLADRVRRDPDVRIRQQAANALAAVLNRQQAFDATALKSAARTALPALSAAAQSDVVDSVRADALRAIMAAPLPSDAVLDTYLYVAQHDLKQTTRYKALQAIRDLGSDAGDAIPTLQALIESSDATTRRVAEQALQSVQQNAPRHKQDAAAQTLAASPGSEAALRKLRELDKPFTIQGFKMALMHADTELVATYLDAGMSPNQQLDKAGMAPLHTLFFSIAGLPGRETKTEVIPLIQTLIARGADVNLADQRGNTPLMLASPKVDAEAIRLLLDAGADVNAENAQGMTALEMTLWSPNAASEAIVDAGFKLTPEKAARYEKAYQNNPKALELIQRASP